MRARLEGVEMVETWVVMSGLGGIREVMFCWWFVSEDISICRIRDVESSEHSSEEI